MIFYGAKTITRGQKLLSDLPCEKCDNDAFILTNHYTSGHIFGIPFLGIVTKTMAYCTGCKKKFTINRLNKKYNLDLTKEQIKQIKSELYGQISEDEKKWLKKRNIIGIVTFSILMLFFVIVIISSALNA